MKKIFSLLLCLSLLILPLAIPASACEIYAGAPGCQVPTYTHNVNIGTGQTNETFHPSTDIITKKQMYLNLTRVTAEYVFNATSGLIYNNYLWGEYDEDIGTHEGVDMRKSQGTNVRTSLSGVVVYPLAGQTTNSYGRVSIYNSTYNVTISFMHMKNITVTNGQSVSIGTVIGQQGKAGVSASHLHIQVEQGNTTSVSSGTENVFTSKIPYGYMSVDTI